MLLADNLKIPGQKKVPLVIGGIGTESAIPYMRSLLRLNHSAKRDQDHLGYLMLVASRIPDRTEAILKKQQGDSSQYKEIAQLITDYATFGKEQGFDFLVTICNTIHTWREDTELGLNNKLSEIGIPWISIMESVAEDLQEKYESGTRIAIFATTGTLLSKLYHTSLIKAGFVPVAPDPDSPVQKNIMNAIYNPEFGIKAKGVTPKAVELLHEGTKWAESMDTPVAIAGCTEIPLGLNEQTYYGEIKIINPLDSLAKKTLSLCL